MDDDRRSAVAATLFDFLKSPSLRHLRDPHSVRKLAREIVGVLDSAGSVWKKWDGKREEVAKAAALCWIPLEDLQAFLNTLPGPLLTKTDVEQRLRAIWEEPYMSYPNDDVKDSCLALYQLEKEQGTEMRAIIGALQEHVERQEERLRRERDENWRRVKEEQRIALERRFLSGADCGWTAIGKSHVLYCRRNGRAFRIVQGKDKRWALYRIKNTEDDGHQLGTYRGRGDANKALEEIAYAPEAP